MAEKPIKTGKTIRLIPLRQAGVTVKDVSERPSKALFDEVAKQELEQTRATPPTPPTPLNNSDKLEKPKVHQNTIAPSRDFQKVANSIVREAIPIGVFKGKSKFIYDCLYLLTRGAVVPKRSVRIPKKDLMKRSGIGSERTLLKNLSHLKSVSLLTITEYEGQHEGNEYEVYLPEEIGLDLQEVKLLIPPTPPTPRQAEQSLSKVGTLPPVESGVSDVGSNPAIIEAKAIFKTLIKDFEMSDDDVYAVVKFIKNLNETCRKVTGKNLTSKDFKQLSEELSEIISNETILASLRTKSVSSFIPFMTENLRRRLYSKQQPSGKRSAKKDNRPAHLDVGKGTEPANEEEGTSPTWTLQSPLTEEQRENTLNALKEAKSENSILYREFKTYGEIEYSPEDFEWLLENLEKQGD